MSFQYQQMGGIGRSRVVITDSGGRLVFDYTFPLCQQQGYFEKWVEESFLQTLISTNINSPEARRIKHFTGFWGQWQLDYTGLPVPASVAEKFIDLVNSQADAYLIEFYPKVNSFPNRKFAVNYIQQETSFNNSDDPKDIGNFGLIMMFETVRTYRTIDIQAQPTITYNGTTLEGVLKGFLQ